MIPQSYISCVRGTTAIEYVLIAAGIALAILGVVFAFGENVFTLYEGLEGALSNE